MSVGPFHPLFIKILQAFFCALFIPFFLLFLGKWNLLFFLITTFHSTICYMVVYIYIMFFFVCIEYSFYYSNFSFVPGFHMTYTLSFLVIGVIFFCKSLRLKYSEMFTVVILYLLALYHLHNVTSSFQLTY